MFGSPHGDRRHITLQHVIAAAQASAITPQEAARRVYAETLRALGGARSPLPTPPPTPQAEPSLEGRAAGEARSWQNEPRVPAGSAAGEWSGGAPVRHTHAHTHRNGTHHTHAHSHRSGAGHHGGHGGHGSHKRADAWSDDHDHDHDHDHADGD